MAITLWDNGGTPLISVPAPGVGDPDWFAVDYFETNSAHTVHSGGCDFVWGGGPWQDYSKVLRCAPIVSGSGQQGWQWLFRRPTSGSYSVRLYAYIEDGVY